MTTRTTLILFGIIFTLGIFLVVILPFFLVKRPPSTPTIKNSTKQENQITDQGIFRSDDGGLTWHQKPWIEASNGSIAPLVVNRIVQDPADPQTIYLATDGQGIWISKSRGDLWAPVKDHTNTLDPLANVLALAVNPANTLEWYVAAFQKNRGRLLVTTDGGKSFREMYFTPLERFGIFDVAYDRNRSTAEIVTGQGGFLETQDQGRTWRVRRWFADGLTRLLVDPANSAREYVVSSRGSIFRTEDQGHSWFDVTEGLRGYSSATTNQNWFIDGSGTLYLASNYGLLRSRDHGVSFKAPPLIIPPDALPVLAVAVDPKNPNHIIASALNQLYRSRDDGETWAILPSPSTKRITHLLFDSESTSTIYAVVAP